MTELKQLAPEKWRSEIAAAITQRGERFGCAWATREGAWRAVMLV